MRKFPKTRERQHIYLEFIIIPNLAMFFAAFMLFDYHYRENFCKFRSGVSDTKFLYYFMIILCAYNIGKILLTVVEFRIRTSADKEYWYKDKFNIVRALSEKQFKRMAILALLTLVCFLCMFGLGGNIWKFNITEEYRTALRNKHQAEQESETSSEEKNIPAELLDMNLQIKLEMREDDNCHNYIIITRPKILGFDNADISDRNKQKIDFLIKRDGEIIDFQHAMNGEYGVFGGAYDMEYGNYEITLVQGHDITTGDYIPISNTIYFTFDENTINEDVEWYDAKINYKSVPLDKEAARKKADEIAAETEK